jgi:hypothetical protein
VLAVAALTGCASGVSPVKGHLVYEDGEPVKELAGFTVTFTSEKLGKSAVGDIDEEGAFRLTTERRGDGAFPGEYKVILTQPHPNPERGERRKPVVDLMYEDPQKTPLEATVESRMNEFTFKLRRIK